VAKENYFQSGPVFVINDPEKPLFFHLGLRDCFSCGSLVFLKKKQKKKKNLMVVIGAGNFMCHG
jgi:hypothetical protein